ncbi:hypothetical protein [Ruminococcus callidus]|uniref:hypothetical protein n=1 Tax=Ruminococcus callidus TaxID=40519 RepID=UPI000B0ACF3A|nr:hypothetical protein [Ruminococcus callidus]MCB5775895.1 hypothetical protein [Ruminococcus callidus]
MAHRFLHKKDGQLQPAWFPVKAPAFPERPLENRQFSAAFCKKGGGHGGDFVV